MQKETNTDLSIEDLSKENLSAEELSIKDYTDTLDDVSDSNFEGDNFTNDEEICTVADNDSEEAEKKEIHINKTLKTITKQTSVLTKSDHIKLEKAVKEYQDGQVEAFDKIYLYYKPKLERLGYRCNDDDIAQELGIKLIEAVATYKFDSGVRFNTYFWKCAKNHIGTLNIRKNAKKRTAEFGTVSMQQIVATKDSEMSLADFIEDEQAKENFDDTLFDIFLNDSVYCHLKESERQAIKLLIAGYTLEEIGKKLGGITAPAIYIKLKRLKNKKNVGKQLEQLLHR